MIVEVSPEQTGWRADRALGVLVPDLSRRDAKAFFHARLARRKRRYSVSWPSMAAPRAMAMQPVRAISLMP
jgi:hypothetical protein